MSASFFGRCGVSAAAVLIVLWFPGADRLSGQEAADSGTIPTEDWRDASPERWKEIAREDVLAAYGAYVVNHPGMYATQDPSFPALLAQARATGLAYAARADDLSGYRRALAAFSSELQDGHAVAGVATEMFRQRDREVVEWPGFLPAWRGDRLLIHTSRVEGIDLGSEIESCDGSPIREFLRAALLTDYFRPSEAGQWWSRASQPFISRSRNDGRPAACTFVEPDGSRERRDLTWTPAPDDVDLLHARATTGERMDIGVTEPRAGIVFIGLPTFLPSEAEVEAYHLMFDSLRANRANLLPARAIVLDLRKNQGGSSTWSRVLAEILWGEAAVTSRDTFDTRVLWRASPDNIRHLQTLVDKTAKDGFTETSRELAKVAEGMKRAAERGRPFFANDPPEDALAEHPRELSPTDLTTPVYVITPGQCGSSCLNAVDVFTRFTNTRLIGAPTSADTNYLETRIQDLPAGPGSVVIPVKMYVGRARASGEYYEPDILMTDLDWSTERFLDVIEEDLRDGRGSM